MDTKWTLRLTILAAGAALALGGCAVGSQRGSGASARPVASSTPQMFSGEVVLSRDECPTGMTFVGYVFGNVAHDFNAPEVATTDGNTVALSDIASACSVQ